MKGYVARKGDRFYAVIYEGLDPLTGRERRRWHPAGTCEMQARLLAAEPAAARASDRSAAPVSITTPSSALRMTAPSAIGTRSLRRELPSGTAEPATRVSSRRGRRDAGRRVLAHGCAFR
jgi:hypothetical protein